jgi:thioesterase DpgC
MIYLNRRLTAPQALAAGLVDEVVPLAMVDEALGRVANDLLSSGVIGLAANRRAFHRFEEPIDVFRTYMAEFAIEQAEALFGEDLVTNLENHWISRGRKPVRVLNARS